MWYESGWEARILWIQRHDYETEREGPSQAESLQRTGWHWSCQGERKEARAQEEEPSSIQEIWKIETRKTEKNSTE